MVVCRQLGLPARGARAFSYAHFGRGEGPIILDDVQCSGREAYISECPNNGLFHHNCRHYEDAGVSCLCKSDREGENKRVCVCVCVMYSSVLQIEKFASKQMI